MALAVDITDRHGLIVTNVLLVTAKEEQGNAVSAIHFTVKPFNHLYITNKMKHFSFRSGHAVRVAEVIKEDWVKVVHLKICLYRRFPHATFHLLFRHTLDTYQDSQ